VIAFGRQLGGSGESYAAVSARDHRYARGIVLQGSVHTSISFSLGMRRPLQPVQRQAAISGHSA
jgi:hypothetical protein